MRNRTPLVAGVRGSTWQAAHGAMGYLTIPASLVANVVKMLVAFGGKSSNYS